MSVFNLCPPALIYLVFSIIQIVIDIGKGFYNTAFAKNNSFYNIFLYFSITYVY